MSACGHGASSEGILQNMITAQCYSELKPGSSGVVVCLRNVKARPIALSARTTKGRVPAAYVVPPMLGSHEEAKRKEHRYLVSVLML